MFEKQIRIVFCLTGSVALLAFTSCVPLVAGAAVGYIAADEGYRVQSPIKKEE